MYCPKAYVQFASYASQVSPPSTHNQDVHELDIIISGGIFGAARPSIIIEPILRIIKASGLLVLFILLLTFRLFLFFSNKICSNGCCPISADPESYVRGGSNSDKDFFLSSEGREEPKTTIERH